MQNVLFLLAEGCVDLRLCEALGAVLGDLLLCLVFEAFSPSADLWVLVGWCSGGSRKVHLSFSL